MLNIAVIGPLADQTKYLLGNYSGSPNHIVSVLDGLKVEFPRSENQLCSRHTIPADGWRIGSSVGALYSRRPAGFDCEIFFRN